MYRGSCILRILTLSLVMAARHPGLQHSMPKVVNSISCTYVHMRMVERSDRDFAHFRGDDGKRSELEFGVSACLPA